MTKTIGLVLRELGYFYCYNMRLTSEDNPRVQLAYGLRQLLESNRRESKKTHFSLENFAWIRNTSKYPRVAHSANTMYTEIQHDVLSSPTRRILHQKHIYSYFSDHFTLFDSLCFTLPSSSLFSSLDITTQYNNISKDI